MNYTEAGSLARQLMNQHGLHHWLFKWDRAKRRAGLCRHSKQTISLSAYFVVKNNFDEVKDTILHEIAHALAGPRNGHNQIWKDICVKIGAKPIRCYDSDAVDMPAGRWYAKCPSCQREFRHHRKPKGHLNRYCIKCGPEKGSIAFQLVG